MTGIDKTEFFNSRAGRHKANFHAHTTLSDGLRSPDEVEALYRSRGYDVLALTDHWRAGATRSDGDFLLLGGVEFATRNDSVDGMPECWHIVGLGVPEGLEQSLPRTNTDPQGLVDAIKGAGGFDVLAHPKWSLNTADRILRLRGIDAAEIWNTQSGLPYNPDKADSSAVLDPVFSAGRLIPLLASDDSHRYQKEACVASTVICTDDFTPEGILTAIKNWDSYATTGPRFSRVWIEGDRVFAETETPCTAACVNTNHPWLRGAVDCLFGSDGEPVERTSFSMAVGEGTTFLRVTVFDAIGRRAWTNPVAVGEPSR